MGLSLVAGAYFPLVLGSRGSVAAFVAVKAKGGLGARTRLLLGLFHGLGRNNPVRLRI